jgi:uncharacterized membrane protein YeaQ/YmgE (transglycosylase-associated protein family)
MHPVLWVIDGLAAGWLTGKMMAGEGRDLVMDVVMGAAGGIAGGFILSTFSSLVQGKMIFTNLAAMVCGVALTALSCWVTGRREYEYGATD